MASENVIELSETNFDEKVIKASEPVLVDFWAVWCGPCKMAAPAVDEIANDLVGKARVGKVNVDENNALASRYGIQSIPTFLVFKNGAVVEQKVGFQGKSMLAGLLEKYI